MIERKIKNVLNAIVVLTIYFINNVSAQVYVNDMDYVIGDAKQAFIKNQITTEAEADNLLKGFINMGVNGIRIPIFPRDAITGVDVNPNKPIMDYFYRQAVAQGIPIFANPAQGGGGVRIAKNSLSATGGVNNVQAATDELIARMIEFSNEYPDCKWLNPFNEDGRATSSTWTIAQYNTIYSALYNNVNGAELIGPCTWGLAAGIDMLWKTDIADYITVASTHNLGFDHGLWPNFINLAKYYNLPVWDSEVNHNDKHGTGTRLEKAIENKVDGLVLYDSWKNISLTTGAVNSGGENLMALYLIQEEKVNIALNGVATQSSVGYNGATADKAVDGNTSGALSQNSLSIISGNDTPPWWQLDLGSEQLIGDIKIYNRSDNCCKDRLSDFTVYILDSNGITIGSQRITLIPDPSVVIEVNLRGRYVRIEANTSGVAMNLAEVKVFSSRGELSVGNYEDVSVALFPNPVINELNIQAVDTSFNEYVICNIKGQVVLRGELVNNENIIKIDLSKFSNGVYILKLKGYKYLKSYKVIKN